MVLLGAIVIVVRPDATLVWLGRNQIIHVTDIDYEEHKL